MSEWPTIRSELGVIGNLEIADSYVALFLIHNRYESHSGIDTIHGMCGLAIG